MNQRGFTLIEILAVLIILGIIVAFGIPRFLTLDKTAELQKLQAGIVELNSRENLLWCKHKISSTSYNNEELDAAILSELDKTLHEKYKWNGNTLTFGSISVLLERIPATNSNHAIWRKKE